MIIEVDQSNKVEDTAKDTFIGFANGVSSVIKISARDKRKLQALFRETERPKMFMYRVFALLVFFLIEPHLDRIERVVIDQEYPGKEELIKSLLVREVRKRRPEFSAKNVVFQRIGKQSAAHFVVYGAQSKKRSVDRNVKYIDIARRII
jgi:hypothetical protein